MTELSYTIHGDYAIPNLKSSNPADQPIGKYRSRKPMIVTTNLKLDEIKNPPDLAHARIYDRILECCAPILFPGKNFRVERAAATKATAKQIVSQH